MLQGGRDALDAAARGAHEGAEGDARVLRRQAAAPLARQAPPVALQLQQSAEDLLMLRVDGGRVGHRR